MEDKLTKAQFGFRPKNSTSDLMIYLMECLVKRLNQNERALVLFFDLAKAFDTLSHTILLKKLEKYGIRGLPLALMKSYLTGRSQKVMANGVTSNPIPLTIGVP